MDVAGWPGRGQAGDDGRPGAEADQVVRHKVAATSDWRKMLEPASRDVAT